MLAQKTELRRAARSGDAGAGRHGRETRRGLKIEEVAHVRDTARRIAALILLGPQLDANYAATVAEPYTWPKK